MLGVTGVNAYIAKTEKQRERVKQKANLFVQQKVTGVLRDLVLNTPQFTGDLAASWTVVTSKVTPLLGHTPLKNDVGNYDLGAYPAKFKGQQEVYQIALAVNESVIRSLRWNSKISIVNTSPTAVKLQTGSIKEATLRPGNYIPGDVLAIKHVLTKHKYGSVL